MRIFLLLRDRNLKYFTKYINGTKASAVYSILRQYQGTFMKKQKKKAPEVFYKKRCFKSFEKYCEVFKNNFFTKHLRNTDNCTSVPQPATLLKRTLVQMSSCEFCRLSFQKQPFIGILQNICSEIRRNTPKQKFFFQ